MESKNEILEKLSKPLDINEVDFRVQSISAKGFATILAYKDARVDMNRLDEVCGLNWQNKYELINGQLFCFIGVKVDDEWVWRGDVGVESNTEKIKGQASDSFKRAGFRFGIGRELYDYPMIQMMLPPNEFKADGNKAKATYDFKLKQWSWAIEFKDGSPSRLTAMDEKGRLRFDSDKPFNYAPNESTPQAAPAKQPEQSKLPVLVKGSGDWDKIMKFNESGELKSINQIAKNFTLSKDLASEIQGIIKNTKKDPETSDSTLKKLTDRQFEKAKGFTKPKIIGVLAEYKMSDEQKEELVKLIK